MIDKKECQLPNIQSIQEAFELAKIVTQSNFFPDYKNRFHDAAIAILFGQSVGLSWGQSLLNIAVINGRPTVWGDAMLALCKKSPDYESCHETFDEGTLTAFCHVKRKGEKEQIRAYSKEKAQRANLWSKKKNWIENGERMLQMRARSFALRDVFPHVLQGLGCTEEVQDYSTQEKSKPPLSLATEPSNVVSVTETLKAKLLARKEILTSETREILMEMINDYDVKETTIQKWLTRANVQEINQLTEYQAKAVIEMLKEKENNLPEL